MTDIARFKADPAAAILGAAEAATAVMLGNPKAGRSFQPMSPRLDAEARVLRFFAASDSDLHEGLAQDGGASTVTCLVIAPDFDLFASIEGELADVSEPGLIDRLFDDVTAAWFEHGREDPRLRLVEFRPRTAEAWASSNDSACFAWQIEKAKDSEHTPDIGARLTVEFSAYGS